MESLAPDTLVDGRYQIVARIGGGGMGSVYEALQIGLGRPVAIKILHKRYARDGKLVLRFKREAEATARLGHPNIVQVTDFQFSSDHGAYLVMELLSGKNLERRLTDGPLGVEDARSIAIQIASALEVAHAAGIIHRDLKPANIFLTRVGAIGNIVKLLDFGVAKLQRDTGPRLTATGALVGTPRYMSPEQVKGEDLDARADLWSLGVTLYEMLAGRPAFPEPTPATVITAVIASQPDPIRAFRQGVPDELIQIIDRCLYKDRSERFQSAKAVREALEAGLPPALRLRRTAELNAALQSDTVRDQPMQLQPAANTPNQPAFSAPSAQSENPPVDANPSVPPTLPKNRTPLLVAGAIGMTVLGALGAVAIFGGDPADDATTLASNSATAAGDGAAGIVAIRDAGPASMTVVPPKPQTGLAAATPMTTSAMRAVATPSSPMTPTSPMTTPAVPMVAAMQTQEVPPTAMHRTSPTRRSLTEVASPSAEGAGHPHVRPPQFASYASRPLRRVQRHADACARQAGFAWGAPDQRFEVDIDRDGRVRNVTTSNRTDATFSRCLMPRLRHANWARTPTNLPITLSVTYSP